MGVGWGVAGRDMRNNAKLRICIQFVTNASLQCHHSSMTAQLWLVGTQQPLGSNQSVVGFEPGVEQGEDVQSTSVNESIDADAASMILIDSPKLATFNRSDQAYNIKATQ
ncbi:hypothetical protein E2C01_009674 [Portunus trituberculatus]|uniref:Uncharacterized protein n=1 Tax=Portunus trituberculatus TaxID=210409 RepID=A0A5B7D6D6_PORTR|nr:hypothetical protein [Portunus trituberculatus]